MLVNANQEMIAIVDMQHKARESQIKSMMALMEAMQKEMVRDSTWAYVCGSAIASLCAKLFNAFHTTSFHNRWLIESCLPAQSLSFAKFLVADEPPQKEVTRDEFA